MNRLICIEGQDGTGKNTLAIAIEKYIREKMHSPALLLSSPDYLSPSGRMLEYALKGGMGNFVRMDPRSASLLYASNRFEQYTNMGLVEFTKKHKNGYIICDRSWMSNIYFQGAKILFKEIIDATQGTGKSETKFIGFFDSVVDASPIIHRYMWLFPDNDIMWAIRSKARQYIVYLTRPPHEYLKVDRAEVFYEGARWRTKIGELSDFMAREALLEHPWLSEFYTDVNIDSAHYIYLKMVDEDRNTQLRNLKKSLDNHEAATAYQLCVKEFAELLNYDNIVECKRPMYIPAPKVFSIPHYRSKDTLAASMASHSGRIVQDISVSERIDKNRWKCIVARNCPELQL